MGGWKASGTEDEEFFTDATERALRMIVPGTRLPAPSPAAPAVRRAVPGGAHGPGRAAGSQAEVSGTQRPSTVR